VIFKFKNLAHTIISIPKNSIVLSEFREPIGIGYHTYIYIYIDGDGTILSYNSVQDAREDYERLATLISSETTKLRVSDIEIWQSSLKEVDSICKGAGV